MARKDHPGERQDRDYGPNPAAQPTTEDAPPMAQREYTTGANGAMPNHLSVTKAIASKKSFAWIKSNFIGICGVFIASGLLTALLTYLPVTRGQLAETETKFQTKVENLSTKVENQAKDMVEIKDGIKELRSTTMTILFKLTPPPASLPAPAQIPASSLPEKPRPKAKKPHPQRVGLFDRLKR